MADSKSNFPGKGRTSWGGAPSGGDYGEKWYNLIVYIDEPKNKKPKEIRLVGGVFTLFQHYIKFKTRTGKATGYYVLCTNFNPMTGDFKPSDESDCPVCRDFSDQGLPEDLQFYGSYRYYFDAYDIQKIKAGSTDSCFGAVSTNKYGKGDFSKIADSLGCDLDDSQRGCTVNWYLNKEARDPKDRMSFTRGEPLAIRYSDQKNLYLLEHEGKRFIGTPTDFSGIVMEHGVVSAAQIERDLKRVGLYDRLAEVTSATASRQRGNSFDASDKPKTGSVGSTDDDFNTAPESPPEGRKAAAQTTPDDDWGSPAAAPAQQPASSGKKTATGGKQKAAPKEHAASSAVVSAAPLADDWSLPSGSSDTPVVEDLSLSDADKGTATEDLFGDDPW